LKDAPVTNYLKRRLNIVNILTIQTRKEKNMKRTLIIILVMVLLLVSVSPALAGNGKGGGGNGGGGNGNGQGGNGNSNGQQAQNTERHQNRNVEHKAEFTVITGLVTAIDGTATTGSITVLVYGGKDTSLHGTEVTVPTDASTRFVLKDFGPIMFDQVVVGDPVSVAIGSDGIADRVTVGAEVACIPL
jgi:hypothetical protein